MLFDKETQNIFIREIEKYVEKNGGSFIDATLAMCDMYGIEPAIGAKYLTKPIIEKIKEEGIDINILPRNNAVKLPV